MQKLSQKTRGSTSWHISRATSFIALAPRCHLLLPFWKLLLSALVIIWVSIRSELKEIECGASRLASFCKLCFFLLSFPQFWCSWCFYWLFKCFACPNISRFVRSSKSNSLYWSLPFRLASLSYAWLLAIPLYELYSLFVSLFDDPDVELCVVIIFSVRPLN